MHWSQAPEEENNNNNAYVNEADNDIDNDYDEDYNYVMEMCLMR